MTVLLNYFKYKQGAGNFGDELSPFITKELSGGKLKTVYDVSNSGSYRHLIAIGSFIHSARKNDVIWGSGFLDPALSHNFNKLEVRAVRGPITKDFLTKKGIFVPDIYGDPALLYPRVFPQAVTPIKTHKIGIVPHYVHLPHYKTLDKNSFELISPLEHFHQVIEKIRSCSMVISSSLHGLILADAYDIPNYWLTEHPLRHKHYKFHDYFLSQNRPLTDYPSIDHALKSGSAPYGNKINLDNLIEAFPIDLIK